MKSRSCVIFAKLISIVLVIAFVNLNVSPLYAQSYDHPKLVHYLGAQNISNSFNPQIEYEGMLGALIASEFRQSGQDFDTMFSRRNPVNNIYAVVDKKPGRVYLESAVELPFEYKEDVDRIFVAPCLFGGEEQYAYVLRNKDGSAKVDVHSADEFRRDCDEWKGKYGADVVDGVMGQMAISSENRRFFIDELDEAVAAVNTFLGKDENMQGLFERLKGIVSSRRLLIGENLPQVDNGILIEGKLESTDDGGLTSPFINGRVRATNVLKGLLVLDKRFGETGEFESAFEAFWTQYWITDREEEFDLEQAAPGLKHMIVNDLKKNGPGTASNEAYYVYVGDDQVMRRGTYLTDKDGDRMVLTMIDLEPHAFTVMRNFDDVPWESCQGTVKDIKRIFREDAEHDLPEALKVQYKLYRMRQRMLQLGRAERFDEAVALQQEAKEIEENELGITTQEESDANAAHYKGIFEAMPGINEERTVVGDFLECSLPTDIVRGDNNTVEINRYFVMLMSDIKHRMMDANGKMDYAKGAIPNYDPAKHHMGIGYEDRGEPMGNIYDSIIHAVAIHTNRGHFSIGDNGEVHFNPNEIEAQLERGNGHAYVNALALLYYWVRILEGKGWVRMGEDQDPTDKAFLIGEMLNRVDAVVKQYRYTVFGKLSDEECKKILPHFLDLCEYLSRNGIEPHPPCVKETGLTRQDVEEYLLSRNTGHDSPNIASSEGFNVPARPGVAANEGWLLDVDDDEYVKRREQVQGKDGKNRKITLIQLDNLAYEHMMDFTGLSLKDCRNTESDIKRVLRKVAEHDLPESLKQPYELCRARQRLTVLIDDDNYEEAAVIRDQIQALESALAIDDSNRDDRIASYETMFSKMPGINPDMIKVSEFLSCSLPTDIVHSNGIIELNQYFVMLMHKMKQFLRDSGPIPNFNIKKHDVGNGYESRGESKLGNLYDAILNTVGIHSLRGHISVDENGNVLFNPDEFTAQPERGRTHAYQNKLALLFYWIVLLEHKVEVHVIDRAREIIESYPEIFVDDYLTPEDRNNLAYHLGDLVVYLFAQKKQMPYSVPLFPVPYLDTEVTPEMVEEFYLSMNTGKHGPNIASSEGYMAMDDPDEWLTDFAKTPKTKEMSDAIWGILKGSDFADEEEKLKAKNEIYELMEPRWARIFFDNIQDNELFTKAKESGEKVLIALGTSWMPDFEWLPEKNRDFMEKRFLQVFKDMSEAEGLAVEIVMGRTSKELEGKIEEVRAKEGVTIASAIVLDSPEALAGEYFQRMKQDKALLFAVNNEAILDALPTLKEGEVFFARVFEMLTLSVRLASGAALMPHPCIEHEQLPDGTYMLYPKIEKIRYRSAREIYERQKDILNDA